MTNADSNPGAATAGADTIALRPIGTVRSDYQEPHDVAHTHRGWTGDVSSIQLVPEHARGLSGLTGYSHLIVLFWIHRASEWKLPEHHHKPAHVEVFATRMPARPNPIGMSVVELLDFSPETGRITVRGLDALDGTPVLDLKPYIPDFDAHPGACIPEWVAKHLRSHWHSHGDGLSAEHKQSDE
jgi:tRNA-Thr(GGU) m(6)t(6)A37 methyltransferase TsaA